MFLVSIEHGIVDRDMVSGCDVLAGIESVTALSGVEAVRSKVCETTGTDAHLPQGKVCGLHLRANRTLGR